MATESLACAACKGTFFAPVHAEQYLKGGYGSAEFRSISNAPKTVLICIGCGTPITPAPSFYSRSTVAGAAEQEFRKSIEAGQAYRDKNSLKNIASIAVAPSEMREVRELVEDIRKAIDVKPLKAPKPKQEVKSTRTGD